MLCSTLEPPLSNKNGKGEEQKLFADRDKTFEPAYMHQMTKNISIQVNLIKQRMANESPRNIPSWSLKKEGFDAADVAPILLINKMSIPNQF